MAKPCVVISRNAFALLCKAPPLAFCLTPKTHFPRSAGTELYMRHLIPPPRGGGGLCVAKAGGGDARRAGHDKRFAQATPINLATARPLPPRRRKD